MIGVEGETPGCGSIDSKALSRISVDGRLPIRSRGVVL